jgi:hypothetical protein
MPRRNTLTQGRSLHSKAPPIAPSESGLGKLVEKSQGPSPVHATDVGNGFAMVLYSDDSVRTCSMRDPEVEQVLEDELSIARGKRRTELHL